MPTLPLFVARDVRPAAVPDRPAWNGCAELELAPGEQVCLLAPPGSGKTLLLRTLARLHPIQSGRLVFQSEDITRTSGGRLRGLRRRLIYVGGDPRLTLPPKGNVAEVLVEGLAIHRVDDRAGRQARVERLAPRLGLNPLLLQRQVSSLSAALRQRVALGRALLLEPALLIGDELIDRLDPAAARPLLEDLTRLCRTLHCALLWSASRPALAAAFSDRVLHLTDGELLSA